ncbi:MAG: flagellar hook-length control protein FliK [Planctomycetaceae bacterium]
MDSEHSSLDAEIDPTIVAFADLFLQQALLVHKPPCTAEQGDISLPETQLALTGTLRTDAIDIADAEAFVESPESAGIVASPWTAATTFPPNTTVPEQGEQLPIRAVDSKFDQPDRRENEIASIVRTPPSDSVLESDSALLPAEQQQGMYLSDVGVIDFANNTPASIVHVERARTSDDEVEISRKEAGIIQNVEDHDSTPEPFPENQLTLPKNTDLQPVTKQMREASIRVEGVDATRHGDDRGSVTSDGSVNTSLAIASTGEVVRNVVSEQTIPTPVSAPVQTVIAAQIARTVESVVVGMESGEVVSVDADLRPPELGRVRIQLTKDDSGLRVIVTAEDPAVHQTIAQHVTAIEQVVRQELPQNGWLHIQLSDQSASHGTSTFHHGGDSQHPPADQRRTPRSLEEVAPRTKTKRADIDVLA